MLIGQMRGKLTSICSIEETKSLGFLPIFVNKGHCASVGWRREIQTCFQKDAEDMENGCKNPKHFIERRFSTTQLCHAH